MLKTRVIGSNLRALLGLAFALATAGCQSDKDSDWSGAAPSGSVSDINRKLTGRPESTAESKREAGKASIVLLVVYDAEGTPIYVETQGSSGDPAIDRRAQDFVLKEKRFPKGKPNTIVLTLNPKEIPKP